MTFEERYGMTREALLREVRRRNEEREEARVAALTELSRLERIEMEAAAKPVKQAGKPGSVRRKRKQIPGAFFPETAG